MSRVATPRGAQPTTTPPPQALVQVPREKIAMRAYEKWVKRGRPHGTDVQDWIEAEAELRAEIVRSATGTPHRR